MKQVCAIGVLFELVLAQFSLAAGTAPIRPDPRTPSIDPGDSAIPRLILAHHSYFTDSRVSDSLRAEGESARLAAMRQQAESGGSESRAVAASQSARPVATEARNGALPAAGPGDAGQGEAAGTAGSGPIRWVWWVMMPLVGAALTAAVAARAVWRDERQDLD